jgi:hypothetical protein
VIAILFGTQEIFQPIMEASPLNSPPTPELSIADRERHGFQGGHWEDTIEPNGDPWWFSQEHLLHEHDRILDYRASVNGDRLLLQRRRFDIRNLVDHLSNLEDDFLLALETSTTDPSVDQVRPLYKMLQEIRRVRGEIRTQENAYQKDDDALASDEATLGAQERSFYQKYEGSVLRESRLPLPTPPRSTNPARPRRKKRKPTRQPTSAVDQYQTKIGEATILHERLEGLPLERQEYLQEQQNLAALGRELDPLDLEFLNTYEETVADYKVQIATLEDEIYQLEPAALDSGLDPEMRYSQIKPHVVNQLPFGEADFPYGQSKSPSDMETMHIDLKLEDGENRQPGTNALSATPPKTEIYQWLQGVPTYAFRQFYRTIRRRGGRSNSWIQVPWNWVPVHRGGKQPDMAEPGDATATGRPQFEQISRNWVTVEPLPSSQAFTNMDYDLELPQHARSDGNYHTSLNDETAHYFGLASLSPPSIAPQDITLEDRKPDPKNFETQSI